MSDTIITALIGCISGGAIGSIITTILNHKRDTKTIESDLEKYYSEKIQDFTDKTMAKYEALQAKYDTDISELNSRINKLTNGITVLNRWIIIDSAKHRNWLVDELKKRDPDIQIPDCPEPPDVFRSIFNTESDTVSDVEIITPEQE